MDAKLPFQNGRLVSTKLLPVLNLATKVVTIISDPKFMALNVNYVLKGRTDYCFSTDSILATHLSIDLNWNHIDFKFFDIRSLLNFTIVGSNILNTFGNQKFTKFIIRFKI